jgi:hypothetical protein
MHESKIGGRTAGRPCIRRYEDVELVTPELRPQLPPLYSQESAEDPLVICKFFTPDAGWTWYALEFDGDDVFFGWVVGFAQELGYFLLSELEALRGEKAPSGAVGRGVGGS